jgi:hypothetical protein
MGYTTKYRCEFYDIKGLEWRWDFELDPYTTPVYPMQASGSPAKYEPLADGDELYENPIRGTKATLTIKSTSLFQYSEFFTMTELQMRCSIYYGDGHTLYFRGYVAPFSYSEPYNDYPYDIEIGVTCGLGALKNIKFEASAGVLYTGRRLESQIILDILGKINVVSFSEIINIYETRMNTGVADSPLDQVEPDVSVYDEKNCYEVLERLLNKWNAIIRHRNGVFYIYRPCEMITTAYCRTFTTATTKTGSTVTSVKKLLRTTSATADLRDINGGRMPLLPPAKKITIHQDYGNRESWLKNWKFEANKFTGSIIGGYTAEGWTNVGMSPPNVSPVNYGIPSESEGIVLVARNTAPALSKYITRTFAPNTKASSLTTGDVGLFEFEYQWFSTKGSPASGRVFTFTLTTVDAGHGLQIVDGTVCQWLTSAYAMTITETVPDGASDWNKWSRKFIGFPHDGEYIANFYCLNDDEPIVIGIRNVKFITTSDEITVKKYKSYQWPFGFLTKWKKYYSNLDIVEIVKKDIIISNAINGEDKEYDHITGDVSTVDANMDNILEQLAGSLAVVDYWTKTAADFVTAHGASFTGILVTSSGKYIYFTENDGNDFTGATSIINATGDLAGTVLTTTPHSVSQPQIDQVVIVTGTAVSSIDITIGALTRRCSWNTDPETTVNNFVGAGNIALYAAIGITLAKNDTVPADGFTFTSAPGTANAFTTSIVQVNPTLTYILTTDQTAADTVARIDRITLIGETGTAKIVCDNVPSSSVVNITIAGTLAHSETWNRRGGAENDPLLEITGGEICAQMARSRVMLSIPIIDLDANDLNPHIDPIGCFEDDLNQVGGNNRIFAFNRGVFDMKNRHWDIDMIEIV